MVFWHKPWLKRNFKSKIFYMNVDYIIKHLDLHDKKKVKGLVRFIEQKIWQDRKEEGVIDQLEKGKDPLSLDPIRLVLHTFREEFRVEDGISRLKAFKKKNIKKIKCYLRVGEW